MLSDPCRAARTAPVNTFLGHSTADEGQASGRCTHLMEDLQTQERLQKRDITWPCPFPVCARECGWPPPASSFPSQGFWVGNPDRGEPSTGLRPVLGRAEDRVNRFCGHRRTAVRQCCLPRGADQGHVRCPAVMLASGHLQRGVRQYGPAGSCCTGQTTAWDRCRAARLLSSLFASTSAW